MKVGGAGETAREPRTGKPCNRGRPDPTRRPRQPGATRQVGAPGKRAAEDRCGVRSAHSTLRRESRSHGEGADRQTEPAQAPWTGHGGPAPHVNLLAGIAKQAREQPKHRVGNLDEVLKEAYLRECWSDIRKDAASGVEHGSAEPYERHLEETIHDLVERLKGKRSRATLGKRHDIPKGNGPRRPLGIPAVEDKLRQRAVARILEAIDEQDCLRWSDGYRPQVGALDAVDKRTVKLQCGRDHVMVEADIKGFFDNIQHDWLIWMLEERLEDGAVLRLLRKWLKAGVLETDGHVIPPVTGTPQGGVISPILANVYLHDALDRWFQKVVKPRGCGEACLIRSADDCVAALQYPEEADRFYPEVGPRLGKFGLEVAPDKTRVIPFSHQHARGRTSFDCLGFEFRWGTDRAGKPHVKRRTARKKLRNSIKRFTAWCRETCRSRVRDGFRDLNAKRRGSYRYDGVHGNSPSRQQFFHQAMRLLFKWLNRRRQRRSYTWTGFTELLRHFRVERPRLVGRPNTRMAALEA
jgi:RNA-directed DNA polymerase